VFERIVAAARLLRYSMSTVKYAAYPASWRREPDPHGVVSSTTETNL
jgi:hypothetical protein